MSHCNGVELSKDRLKRVTQAEKQIETATTDSQLLGLDVDIAAVLTEDGAIKLFLGRVLKMFVPKTGRGRGLKAIVHAVDPYNMPAGLKLSCRWYRKQPNNNLDYKYDLDDSERYDGTCFLSFVNFTYDQDRDLYRLSNEDAATLADLHREHQQNESDERED